MVFSSKVSSPRTDEDFRGLKYGVHHKIDSPLLKLPIDMVEQFPVADSLHLIHLGIMKRLLTGWKVGNFGNLKTKWCARDIDHVNLFLSKCNLHLLRNRPSEIHRAVRTLDCIAYWKATEFRTFLHYLSIIILQEVLPVDAYQHFLSLFCGVTICYSPSYKHLLRLTNEMFGHFVENYKQFYGADYITSNVHNLLHVADEVERFGPLPTFDAYPFENKLYLIKNMLRHGDKPLSQIAKRLLEQNLNTKFPNRNSKYEKPYLTRVKDVVVLNFEHYIISCKERNKYFLSSTNDIIEVLSISNDGQKIKIQGQKLMGKMLVFEKPLRSSFLNIYKVFARSSERTDAVLSPDDVNCKLVCVAHGGFLYFIPL